MLAPPRPDRWFLDNGLCVLYLPVRQAALVSTVLCYRAGTSDEKRKQAGAAHFLEHMMFKGSRRYGPGDIDRATQRRGGWNNAFTGHDSTVYVFGFASDRWHEALAIEADRMRGLTLDAVEVDSEREVVIEEIAMYLDDPWDSLELEVHARLFGDHPYSRPILGSVKSLRGIDAQTLGAFHQRHYTPSNGVLAIAGDVEREAVERAVGKHFGSVRGDREPRLRVSPPFEGPQEAVRVTRRKGDTARFLLALPGPPADDPDHSALALALAVLAGGRSGRLHRRLVEELQLCSRVAADVAEMVGPGVISLSAEAMPGVQPAEIEDQVLLQLRLLCETPPDGPEVERSKSTLAADWVFGHERIHQQALLVATAEALFSPDHPARQLRQLQDCTPDQVTEAARRYLSPDRGSVTGWSLPDGVELP